MTNEQSTPEQEAVVALLDSFETGDQTTAAAINPDCYIQHNPRLTSSALPLNLPNA